VLQLPIWVSATPSLADKLENLNLSVSSSAELGAVKKERLAHREDRTRSLQIIIEVMARLCARYKSLTLYPIELGGRLGMNPTEAS
jgi:hypothetical protein